MKSKQKKIPHEITEIGKNLLLEHLLSYLPVHVYWQDMEGNLLGCNQMQAESLGFTDPSEVIGKHPNKLLPKKEAAHLMNILHKVIKKGEPITLEEEITFKQGSSYFISYKIPIKDKGRGIVGLLGISADITARKKAEIALERANKVKSRFLHILQHNLRNKLTGVLSFSDLILDLKKKENEIETITEWVSIIKESAEQVLPFLDRISYYLSFEEGAAKPCYSEFDLSALFHEFLNAHKTSISEKNLNVNLSFDSALKGFFETDYQLVYEVIDNLFSNAIRFSPKNGSIFFEARFVRKEGSDILLDLLIRDEGEGISMERQQKIFNLFDFSESTGKQSYLKPGINLSISKKIAEILGGDLVVESWKNKGTTFIFSLKAKKVSSAKSSKLLSKKHYHHIESSDEITSKKEETLKDGLISILLVEDEEINVKAMKTILTANFNCQIHVAQTLAEAKKTIHEEKCLDLIFLDIGLPDGEGWELMDLLELAYSDQKKCPYVIANTAYASQSDLHFFYKKGIKDILIKPITPEIIISVISGLFGASIIKKD